MKITPQIKIRPKQKPKKKKKTDREKKSKSLFPSLFLSLCPLHFLLTVQELHLTSISVVSLYIEYKPIIAFQYM